MRNVRNLFVIAIVLSVPARASANGLLYKLPADGTTVVYDMKMTITQANITVPGTLTMSSVGKAKAGGKSCRWIEFTMAMSFMGQNQEITAKVLVPEEDLGKGKNPLKNPQKGWLRQRAGQPTKEIKDYNSRDAGPLPAFLAGPLAESKKLKLMEIDSGLGKLKCAGETGTHSYKQGAKDTLVTYTTRLSTKSPFGVASSKMTIKESQDGNARSNVELTFTIKSIGKDAKSKLPDQK